MRHHGSAAPPHRRHRSHHSKQSSNWAVPCACASDSNCFPPLRAARAHAMVPKTSPCKSLLSRVPARPLPVPPGKCQSQVCFTCLRSTVPADQRGYSAQTGQSARQAQASQCPSSRWKGSRAPPWRARGAPRSYGPLGSNTGRDIRRRLIALAHLLPRCPLPRDPASIANSQHF